MAAGRTIDVTEESFEEEVLGSDIPVLVDYWAPWCGPCRMVAPVLEKIADEYEGRLKICKLNIDENREIATQHQIMSVPTMFLFKDGVLVDQIAGMTQNFESDLKRRIDPYVE